MEHRGEIRARGKGLEHQSVGTVIKAMAEMRAHRKSAQSKKSRGQVGILGERWAEEGNHEVEGKGLLGGGKEDQGE